MIGAIHTFATRDLLATALAERILNWAKDCTPPGRLELSGGATPRELFETLRRQPLPQGIDVLPVDDRCVAPDHKYSNVGALQRALGAYRARPLFDEQRGIGGSVAALREAIGFENPGSRFTVLGLGPDGHTASLFPGSSDLAAGLDACAPAFIAAQPTMDPMVPRITMTAPFLLASNQLVLHFHGKDKWRVFEAAQTMTSNIHPIAHFLRYPNKTLDVYYAD